MIKRITVTNYLGESIDLELARPEKSGFVVKSITGLGPGKANVNVSEVSTTDGGTFNSARLSSRNIVLSLGFLRKDTIEETRYRSYKYFPLKKKVSLLIETDTRRAEIEGIVESNEPNIWSKSEGADISIVCPNPYFQSGGKDGIQSTLFYGVSPLFEFPFSNDSLTDDMLLFGSINNNTEQLITYKGDAEVGITISIHAMDEATNVAIYNIRTREIMRIDTDKLAVLTGSGIKKGDDIVICTEKGKKSITLTRDGETINILNCLDRDADWFQLTKGDNIFAYTAETGSNKLQFKIDNRVLYEGV